MQLGIILAALISAVGTLCGALGGIALTSGLEARRQQRQAESAAAHERAVVREQARADLLAAITRLRVDIEITCARHWRDMNVRLAAIQEQAATTGVLASRIALLSPGQEAEIAMALGKCASGLAALTAKSMKLGEYEGPNNQFMAGDLTGVRPDLAELERLVAALLKQISLDQATTSAETPASSEVQGNVATGAIASGRVSQPLQ
jgi:hypothetical protein